MQRTAEEFVHQLPGGRWFVGDFVRTAPGGQRIYLIETRSLHLPGEVPVSTIVRAGDAIATYAHKSSAKRAAQRMLDRVLLGRAR